MRNILLLLFGLTGVGATGCATTCEPVGPSYCEGDILKECVADGEKGISKETDCAASGEVCAMNTNSTTTAAAECRPADCDEGWICFSANEGHRMCDLAEENVFVCVDEGAGCFGWERVEECAALGEGLSCVALEETNDASCE